MNRTRTLFILAALAALVRLAPAANEITAQASLVATKGFLNVSRQANSAFNITNTAPNVAGYTQLLGTNAAEQITFGDVQTPGWAWFRNLGTNTVSLGVVDASTNFIEFARMKAGEYGLIPVGTNGLYGMSIGTNETGTVLEKIILDR